MSHCVFKALCFLYFYFYVTKRITIHDNDTVPENLEKREQEENKRLKEEQARLAKEADSNNKSYIVNTKRNSFSHLGPGMNASYLQDFEQEASPTKFKRSKPSKKDRVSDLISFLQYIK
jgi:hypothetical protein